MSTVNWFVERQAEREQQTQAAANEVVAMADRIEELSREVAHWKASPLMEKTHKRLLKIAAVLRNEEASDNDG